MAMYDKLSNFEKAEFRKGCCRKIVNGVAKVDKRKLEHVLRAKDQLR